MFAARAMHDDASFDLRIESALGGGFCSDGQTVTKFAYSLIAFRGFIGVLPPVLVDSSLIYR